MAGRRDPHAVLGVAPGADQAEIHAAYRTAVRRTHPDAGGTAVAFEEVQEAYEALRDTPGRGAARGARGRPARPPRPAPPPADDRPGPQGDDAERRAARGRMEEILAESRRLEDEARRLAGLPPRHDDTPRHDPDTAGSSTVPEGADSVGAILRDAGGQLRDAAVPIGRELRRRLRRYL